MSVETGVPINTQKKFKKKKLKGKVLAAIIVMAILAASGILLWKFVFAENNEKGSILTDIAVRGTIQSRVEGSGTTKAKDSATITLAAGGTVVDVYIEEGQFVTEGQELYRINSTAAEEAVYTARETLNNIEKEMDDLKEEYNELTIRAPFAGQLREVSEFSVGDKVPKGTKVATLVDDSRFKLTLFFSYAYKDAIYIGQTAQVTIPEAMAVVNGKIEKIDYVRRVSPEGTLLFQAVVVIDNPGVLTEGVSASAILTAADGSQFYAYAPAETEFYRKAVINTKAEGSVEKINLLNYKDVTEGEALLVLGVEDTESRIRAKQKELDDALEKFNEAQKALDNFNAVAPISGTVVSCSLLPGKEVTSGQTAVTISDTSEMIVEIQIDERNVGFVKTGMIIDIDQWGNVYSGIVESISLEGNTSSGMSTFPAIVKVDNTNGQLMSGMYVTYSFVASQSDNCLTIPIQCVRYVNDEKGLPATVVFLKADKRPDNAITLGADVQADIPEGFYAVPVTIGLSDIYNVEIIEGLTDGDVVFTNYETNQSDSFSGMMAG
jgi:HlyD family secretion protein